MTYNATIKPDPNSSNPNSVRRLGFGPNVYLGKGVRRTRDGTRRIVVAGGRIEGDMEPTARAGSRVTRASHDPDPAQASTTLGDSSDAGDGQRYGERGDHRRTERGDTADLPADRGLRAPALHQPGAVEARLRRPAPRPGRGRRAAAHGAGEVPRHLLRAARRVLPDQGRRAGGPGRRRRAHALGRRAAPGGTADHDPQSGRRARAPRGPHLPRAHRPRVRGSRHPALGLVVPRRRRPRASRRRVPASDLSGAHPAGGRPGAPLPLHLEPLAQPGGRRPGPLVGRQPDRHASRSRRRCPASWSCPTASVSCHWNRSSPRTSTRSSRA